MIVETRWRATIEFSTLAEDDIKDTLRVPEIVASKAGQNAILLDVGVVDMHVMADVPMAVSDMQENLPNPGGTG